MQILLLRLVVTLLALADGGPPGNDARRPPANAAEVPPNEAVRPSPGRPRSERRSRWAQGLARLFPLVAILIIIAGGALWFFGQQEPEQLPELVRGEQLPLGLLLVGLSLTAVWVLWRVPQWQAAAWAEQSGADPRERFEIENASRATLGQILSGVAVLAGLVFAWQQLGSATRSVQLSEQGQITDRFTRAVEQLGSDQASTRLGGIYALERVARDSERDYGPSMEVLTEFIREQPLDDPATPAASPRLSREAAAAMRVIARRTPEQLALQVRQGLPCLDLSGAQLTQLTLPDEANLSALCLEGTNLSGATLVGASFIDSELEDADLNSSSLEGWTFQDSSLVNADLGASELANVTFSNVSLLGADLSGSLLTSTTFVDSQLLGAKMKGAILTGTTFAATDVTDVDFSGAVFAGADLSGALNLTGSQLQTAFVDDATILPADDGPDSDA